MKSCRKFSCLGQPLKISQQLLLIVMVALLTNCTTTTDNVKEKQYHDLFELFTPIRNETTARCREVRK